jgi:putative ABC transport system permease protein
MKVTDIVKLSLNSLTHRGLRSWLTILGIIIGVAAVIAMLSIGTGMSQSVEAQMSGLGADILTVSPGYTQAQGAQGGMEAMRKNFERMFGGGDQESSDDDPTLTEMDILTIRDTEGVEYAAGVIIGNRVEVEYLSESVSLNFEGIDPEVWPEMITSNLDSGRFLNYGDSNSVVLGYSVAYEMFDQPLGVNTQIKIESTTFKVVGILSQSGTGMMGGDDRSIFMTHDSARNLVDGIDNDEYSTIEVKISDTDNVEEIAQNIENSLYYSRIVTEETQDFTVSSSMSMIETLTSTMETLSFFLIGIAAISLLVGAIGISNTMFMSVMERTRLIGILKSLGSRNSEIMKLFLAESAIIGLMGGLLGVFLGFILVGVISGAGISFMNMGRMAGSASQSVAVITPELIVFALVFSTVIGIISGLIPARKAAKLQVVEAMRSE